MSIKKVTHIPLRCIGINGEGSYRLALEEYRDIVISVEDEVSEIIPELSPE